MVFSSYRIDRMVPLPLISSTVLPQRYIILYFTGKGADESLVVAVFHIEWITRGEYGRILGGSDLPVYHTVCTAERGSLLTFNRRYFRQHQPGKSSPYLAARGMHKLHPSHNVTISSIAKSTNAICQPYLNKTIILRLLLYITVRLNLYISVLTLYFIGLIYRY